MNRMRCRSDDGGTWTTVRERELRKRLGVALRLGIGTGSVQRIIRDGALPASQLMSSAPWKESVEALDSEAVRIGVREIVARRPGHFKQLQDDRTLRLPGI